jgi:hypothetical protein
LSFLIRPASTPIPFDRSPRAITADFVANTDALNILPDAKGVAVYRGKAAACSTALRALASHGASG